MPHPGHRSFSLPSCFRTTAASAPKTVLSANPDLTTSLYQTQQGLFGLTWSKGSFGTRSLHIYLLLDNHHLSFPPSPSFHLQFNPRFTFWKKRGSKTLVGLLNTSSTTARVFWDLSRAKFGSRPDPASGYYVAILIGGEMTLLVGEELLPLCQLPRSIASGGGGARPTPKETAAAEIRNQVMVLRREHVYGNKKRLYYTTRANIGGGEQEIDVSIDYRAIGGEGGPTLCFSIADKRVLQVKHLKWKFRGNERVEGDDGIPPVQVSWDVYNWLFVQDDDHELTNGYALFMFKFERKPGGLITEEEEEDDEEKDAHHHHDYSYYDFVTNSGNLKKNEVEKNKTLQQDCGGLNLIGFEKKKKTTTTMMMKKGFKMRSGRSWSSSSLSSVSSSSNSTSSVMEWASVEENELKGGPCGFSLVVYAWN
ncbi:uncharacterized protein LOC113779350 [Coffea eugenioides]|uniref:uncharacterized protein LOC113779350 n=1 Tax=Coffea eugenioides TaxID=49369 RepID=UPI000F60DAFA|nr:uncharacterized protein LOC113779350 [Coffea eugenioides]